MSPTVDVCMLVEGTYPYVSGGVSSWIHSLITNLSDMTFSIVFIGALPDPARTAHYQLPPNVVAIHDVYLQDTEAVDQHPRGESNPDAWNALREFHEALAIEDLTNITGMFERVSDLLTNSLVTSDLLMSKESWEMLVEQYSARSPNSPFLDYFWTFRATHLPIFRLLEAKVPPARLYHAPSAGFSGLLGAMTKNRTGAPFLLTEHGVYMHEREIEIAQSEWIPDHQQRSYRLDQRPGLLKEWWTGMFRFMTRVAYDRADEIISVTTGNQRFQIHEGARLHKMTVIPNGVDISRYSGIRTSLARQSPGFSVGFVGRVVPIKDVKTFIRAIGAASATIPDITVSIVGPTDEDPQYFAECQQLVTMLGLTQVIQFTGRADVREYYKMLDVLVLTSISEAAPLVILEANCAGVPVIATNVGACKELIEGETAEDQAIGPSGLLTTVSSAQETADALIQLSRDEVLRQEMAQAGQTRARRFYDVENLYATYRGLYQRYLEQATVPLAND